ncbi:protein-disulfide reductase DsbD domain-containing protein [Paracoccus aerodenitrificans]|uniref:protein-disulfide reductase DsbD domain-containing protein n=1 Tax=Paracoccus aerodenitrificans TaxID=3017781 RepID=UPI0022F093D9|nr:protein-disulfide reductase DsbD domain-containing protein [Paracoccus aerodenitrificans]WBU64005.1 protein-disulfide reductase DsbD family protein [Paracoccus aerodenitrificans]
MKYAILFCLAAAIPAWAGDLPEGLFSARFLPGWTDENGNRIAALELELSPGWKTYWRSPGDAGLAPEFDWKGSNIGKVAFHWPAPEVIDSDGVRTLGFHDRLILPFTIAPDEKDRPIGLSARISLGICENICVPAELTLTAPPAGSSPDPVITEAMRRQPELSRDQPPCSLGEIEDGMTATLSLPEPATNMAVEYGGSDDIWVSRPELSRDGSEISVDFVAPSGKPFPLDPSLIVLTLLKQDGATEYRGCAAG